MVNYKVYYFDVRGLGETIRLLLHYGNVPFEDVRYTHEEWPKHKAKTPTGKLPYIEVDGKPLAESGAIFRYLAAKFGLVAKDAWENAQMESTIETFRDFMTDIRPYFLVAMGREKGDKDELFKTVYQPAAEKMYPRLVEILSKSKSGFLANGGLTWGDFALAESFLTMQNFDPNFAKNYPKLVEYQKKVHAVPQIEKYVKSRKASNV